MASENELTPEQRAYLQTRLVNSNPEVIDAPEKTREQMLMDLARRLMAPKQRPQTTNAVAAPRG